MLKDTTKQAALEWQIVLWSGEVTKEEWAAFNSWLHANQEHQQAWEWLQAVNQPLNQVPEQLASNVLRQGNPSMMRRKMLMSFGLLTGLTAISYGTYKAEPWQGLMADVSTKTGERRTLTLSDGTQLTLNTDTAIDIDFNDSQRTLRLHRGEVMISTSVDMLARPFSVVTDAGMISPIGTRFSVRELNDAAHQTQVNVYQGAVEIHLKAGLMTQLNAGEQQQFSALQIQPSQSLNHHSGAWEQGKLIVEREKLANVIQELNRYRSGVLRCDPAVANLIVSGVYPLDDTDAILQSLQQGLPIKISQLTRYWVTISTP